jgi:hypothetical protein
MAQAVAFVAVAGALTALLMLLFLKAGSINVEAVSGSNARVLGRAAALRGGNSQTAMASAGEFQRVFGNY